MSGSTASGRQERDGGEAAPGENGELRLGALENYIAYHLRIAQNASFQAFRRKTGRSDLRPGWFAVLSLIGDNPGITPAVLSRATGRDKSTLTPVLGDLIREELIRRAPHPRDRRSYGLSLTESGRASLADLGRHAAEHDRRLDEIAGEAKGDLIAVLKRIADEIA